MDLEIVLPRDTNGCLVVSYRDAARSLRRSEHARFSHISLARAYPTHPLIKAHEIWDSVERDNLHPIQFKGSLQEWLLR